jgi:hypothetical protein
VETAYKRRTITPKLRGINLDGPKDWPDARSAKSEKLMVLDYLTSIHLRAMDNHCHVAREISQNSPDTVA